MIGDQGGGAGVRKGTVGCCKEQEWDEREDCNLYTAGRPRAAVCKARIVNKDSGRGKAAVRGCSGVWELLRCDG